MHPVSPIGGRESCVSQSVLLRLGRTLGKGEEEEEEEEEEDREEEGIGSRSILYLLVLIGSFPSAIAFTHSLMSEVSSLASLCPPAHVGKPACCNSCRGEDRVRGGSTSKGLCLAASEDGPQIPGRREPRDISLRPAVGSGRAPHQPGAGRRRRCSIQSQPPRPPRRRHCHRPPLRGTAPLLVQVLLVRIPLPRCPAASCSAARCPVASLPRCPLPCCSARHSALFVTGENYT
ncbi:hypothetical protein E2C01_027163 [Portunus trituberculatus]|uniref:Uncharacterized protein n=1 Tax=Portunus trituberculatus TaxID=210409 RepID=A0A5B7EKX4_PORTR|nr:hypothetical protein [Portunus trituberculatus]